MKEKILGFDVMDTNYKDLISNIFIDINKNQQNFLVNINPLIIMNFYNNKKYIDLFNSEKYQISDGIGILWASKCRKKLIKNRIAGIDLMKKICEEAAVQNKTIFLCGAKPGIPKRTKEELEKEFPKIKIVGYCDGYVSEEEMIKQIKQSKPDILFVALGSPKQENFILNIKQTLIETKLFMPVGGSFDVISGNIKRAPKFYQKTCMEWLYRMIKEPKRIKANLLLFKFVFLVIFTKK